MLAGASTGAWDFGASSGGVGAEKTPSSLGSASRLPVEVCCCCATGTTGVEIPFIIPAGAGAGADTSCAGAGSGCFGALVLVDDATVAAIESRSTPFVMGASSS